jgi:rhodanese-related sulfurtransferase
MVEEVSPAMAWQALTEDPETVLCDVRTEPEWAFVGVPDLGPAGKEAVLIPWQVYPAMQVNAGFVEALREAGVGPEQRVFFLCRSGVRSMAAARAAKAAGYGQASNVAGGFEGPLDAAGHRGGQAGWKADGLPWRQK